MADGTCAIPDCGKPVQARGWCNKHWKRWRVHGDPLAVTPRGTQPGPEHPGWKGDSAKYSAMHMRLRKARGNAKDHPCAQADESCRGRMEWANVSGRHEDVQDYIPLCKSHHVRLDGCRHLPGTKQRTGSAPASR